MGCGASKTHAESDILPSAPVPEEPIGSQTPPQQPVHHAFVVPPLSVPVASTLARHTSAGSLTVNLIQKKRVAGQYIACEGNTIRATTTGSATSIWNTITMRTATGGHLLKLKKALLNEVEAKLSGAESEEHPTYTIYKVGEEHAPSNGLLGSVMRTASSAASTLLDMDSDANIIATLIRVEGTSKVPGAKWQCFEGKVDHSDLHDETRPSLLYELSENTQGERWDLRNSTGKLIGKGFVDWEWRPPEDVAKVEAGSKFASMRLELGPGVDLAIVLACVVSIDDFDDRIWDGKATDSVVEFGNKVRLAFDAFDRVRTPSHSPQHSPRSPRNGSEMLSAPAP